MAIYFNAVAFLVVLFFIYKTSHFVKTLSMRVMIGLVSGVIIGIAFQILYGAKSDVIHQTMRWLNIFGSGYISLLQMIVMPLIVTSVLAAITKISSVSFLGKIGGVILCLLLFTVAIAAFLGMFIVNAFHLTASGLVHNLQFTSTLPDLHTRMAKVETLQVPEFFLSLIPTNPFLDLTGVHTTSITRVVIITVLFALAALAVKKESPKKGEAIIYAIDIMQSWVMKLVRQVITLSPYGTCALIAQVAASSQITDIAKLMDFLILSYLAIFCMFLVHALLVWCFGLNPIRYFSTIMSVLFFAFTSRSSAASIPLNIATQTEGLKNAPSIASLSATLGSTIGQNGCAGIYPAMLATMVAPTLGIDINTGHWIFMLIIVVVLSSIGVAGVGGGAIFSALIVLPNLGLPVTLVAILIAIEPLIDMGRTALNVSGSMVAGTITNQIFKSKIASLEKEEEDFKKQEREN